MVYTETRKSAGEREKEIRVDAHLGNHLDDRFNMMNSLIKLKTE